MRFHGDLPDPEPTAAYHAWERFVSEGRLEENVRPHIRDAWNRSREHGCSPHMPSADTLSAADTVALLRRESRLIEIATPFLAALSRAVGEERHAAMLADGDGRVLKIVADPLTAADEAFPRAGSLLSESAAGANGIGTPLADGHYVELVGPEHYISGFHPFTCQGVPLRFAAGTAAGVISMSVRRLAAARRVRDILFCASEAAECELVSSELLDAVASRGAVADTLEALRQDVVQRIAVTRVQLELAARRIGGGADAADFLHSAEQMIVKFRRQAAVWRNLADEAIGSPEPIDVAELVHDFVGLLETESRVAQVILCEDRLDRVLAIDDRGALSRRLLSAFVTCFQRAARGSTVRVETSTSDTRVLVRLSGVEPSSRHFSMQVESVRLH